MQLSEQKEFLEPRGRTHDEFKVIPFSRCLYSHPAEINRYVMPTGSKASYTDKQKRQASHIEKGYEKRGLSKKTAKARAWATVNKETGGGKKSGEGRRK